MEPDTGAILRCADKLDARSLESLGNINQGVGPAWRYAIRLFKARNGPKRHTRLFGELRG